MRVNVKCIMLFSLFVTRVSSELKLPIISSLLTKVNSTLHNEVCTELVPEDALLSFPELVKKYGFPIESYEVTTEDGYKLTVFRIPGKRKSLPILLFHGLFDSADTWVLRGDISLSITFARKGYDVWLGNSRGNKYSRGHDKLDPNKDPAYWNFTFHELGIYDLSATIDLVLEKTGAKKVNSYGHSQGTTIYFVLCSIRPEYNHKINFVAMLAPIAFLHHTPPPVSTLITLSPILYSVLVALKIYQVSDENSVINKAGRAICPLPILGYDICAFGIFFPLFGYDPPELEPCYLRVFIGHFPLETSAKNLNHFGQVGLRKKFAQYDYGVAGNLRVYNVTKPPEYNLSQVTTKVMLFPSMNDHLSTLPDAELLRERLPNVVEYMVIPRLACNHFDFVQGKTMPAYLYPYIINLPQKYS